MYFVNELDSYERDFDFIENYIRQMAMGLSRSVNISLESATEEVIKIVKENQSYIDNIKITFTLRQKNGDRCIQTTSIMNYLDRILKNGLGMSPTLTTYKTPQQERSLIVEDIAGNMTRRKIVKKEAHLAKLANDTVGATIKNGGQNAIKVLINSWSGATLDKHNAFTSPSTHPTLTTMCRISTALATATVERLLRGKRYYHSPEKVIEDILYTLDTIVRSDIINTMSKFNLHSPTVDEVMDIITFSTQYYWDDKVASERIRNLLTTLTPIELAAVAYDGDFYNLYNLNEELIKNFLTKFSTVDDLPVYEEEYFDKMDGDISNLLSGLMGNIIKGTMIWDYLDEKKHPRDNPTRKHANSVVKNILDTLEEYRELIETFIKVDHFPLNVGAQNHAIRTTVPLGDTDSTIFTTKHINEKYYGVASPDSIYDGINNVCIYMVNGAIAHALAIFTAQMGVVPERRNLLVMKNEFLFPSVVLTPVAKTYHAHVAGQEGLIYDNYQEEMKGARFHAGANNIEVVKELHGIMKNNALKLRNGELVNRGEVIDVMLRIEEDIKESIDRTENVYYKRTRLKSKDQYTKPDSSVYAYHTLWNAVFGERYGFMDEPNPDYYMYKVDLYYPKGHNEFIRSLSTKQQTGIDRWRSVHSKKPDVFPNSILVPIDVFLKHGLPSELKPFVNVSKIASFSLDLHRLYLSALGLDLDKGDEGKMLHDIMEGYIE